MWNQIAIFTLRNRLLILLLVLGGAVFMGWHASHVQLSYDNKKVIPADDPAFVAFERFRQTFGEDGTVMMIGLQSDRLFEPECFEDFKKLTADIDSLDGIERVLSLGNAYDLVRNDSLGKFQLQPLQLDGPAMLAKMDSLPFYKGLLYEPKERVTLIAVTLKKSFLDSKARIKLVQEVEALTRNFSNRYQMEPHFSGLPYIRTVYSTKVADELKTFTLLSIGITALFLLVMFRSFYAVFVSLTVVIIGLVYTFGLLPILGYKITLLTGLLPPLIVVIIIQNCIYILNVYHFECRKHGNKILAMQRVLSKIGLASFITNLTTAVGFGVFVFSGSALLDQFSILSAAAIMLVYVISMTVFPIILSWLPAPQMRQLGHLDRRSTAGFVRFVSKAIFHHRPWIYGISLGLVVIGAVGIMQVKSIGYMVDDLPKNDPVYTDLKFFEKHFKGIMPLEFEIDTREDGGVKSLKTLQKIEKFQRVLAQMPELSRALSVVEFLKMANQAWYDGDPRRYRLPTARDASALTGYLPKGDGVNRKSPLSSMVDSSFRRARISVQMADVGSVKMEELSQQLDSTVKSIFPEDQYTVVMTGSSIINLKGNEYLIDNLIQGLAFALILISLMNASLFFNYKMILITLIPNLIPLALTLGIMGFAGIPLKNSTILVFSVAYGIVVDLTVHFLAKYRIELKKRKYRMSESVAHSVEESGYSMVYTTVILFFGFIIFAFSKFGGTVALGLLTSLSLIIGLLTNLFLLPALLLSLEKSLKKEELESGFIELEDEEA